MTDQEIRVQLIAALAPNHRGGDKTLVERVERLAEYARTGTLPPPPPGTIDS